MIKEGQLQRIIDTGVVAIIRTDDGDELVSICEALVQGGLVAIEITMTSPGAIEAIYSASKKLQGKAMIGAGSVLDTETARIAMLAGADFIVSPIVSRDIIEMCKRYGKIVIPGAFSPTEIMHAWESGADVVKIFPATKLGPAFIKDIKGPMPQVRLTPTGGVGLENLGDFLRAGAAFVGVGSSLVNRQIVAEKAWDKLATLAANYLQEAKAAKNG